MSNLNYDGLEQEQRIRKIASNPVSDEELLRMLQPYLERRKMACECYVKLSEQEKVAIVGQELKRVINYCNIQIKLILLLN